MKTEVYKDIPNYEGLYQVSNFGNVKSLKRKNEAILKKRYDGKAYYAVILYNGNAKSFKVHQLVAIAFLNHNQSGMKVVVNHINGNKLDNRLSNLEIVSQRLNMIDYFNKKDSTSKFIGVSWNKEKNKWSAYIHVEGKSTFLGHFDNEIEANKAYQNKLANINI
jgi:hypothetical protein